jgi:enoyl-CoA hydratase
MDMCLTGRMIDAAEAERSGLVARVVPAAALLDEALAVAAKIAGYSLPAVLKIKESINRAYESSLAEGLLFERREFHATFALEDQKEGMRAFVEKRKPDFKHRRTKAPWVPAYADDEPAASSPRRRPPTTPCPTPPRR